MLSLTIEVVIHFEVVTPWLTGLTHVEAFNHESSQLSLGWQQFEAILFAPFVEESAYRLAFSTSLVSLVAAAKQSGRSALVSSVLATLTLGLVGWASVFFGLGHWVNGVSIAGLCYVAALAVTLPIVARRLTGRPISRGLWVTAALVTTVAFAVMHLDNYVGLPHDPRVALLTIPQLFGGSLFLFAAWQYGLRAAMLTHMAGNALLRLPWFTDYLNWVLATF